MFALASHNELGIEMHVAVVDALKELMTINHKIIALEADLGSASKWSELSKHSPERFINVGIAEANMVGVAAGLSLTGFIPFLHTFGPFATRRVLDQLYLSGAYAKNTFNIFGSYPGFTAGHNGGTHTTLEDIALLRSIPEVTICDAADTTQMKWIIKVFSQQKGLHYVRGNRKNVHTLYREGSTFTLGKGNFLQEGDDYLIVAAGQLVFEALEVAKTLQKNGITSDVIDMFTIKPLDKDLLIERIAGKKAVIILENHSIIDGLGSAVAEVIADNGLSVPLKRIGVDNELGQVGTPAYLQKAYGLTTETILKKSIKIIRKIKKESEANKSVSLP